MDYTKEDGEFYKIGNTYGKLLVGQILTTSRDVEFVSKEIYEANADIIEIPQIVTVPQSITMRQCKLALLAKGLLDIIDGAVLAMDSQEAKIEWEYSTVIEYDNGLVNNLCTMLELNKDELFIYASTI